MKYTLLELTQTILSSMDSDEVSTINDTVESQQVVDVIKTVYDDIVSRSDLNSNKTLFNLTATTDNAKPIIMLKPETIDKVEWIKYNVMDAEDTSPNWNLMRYLPQEQFIDLIHSYDTTESNIENFNHSIGGFTINFAYKNDSAPQYYTSFDDNFIFFDAYDLDVDTTLQASKTVCYGSKVTDFVKSDDFIPNLQPQQFALLLNEAKSLAWIELKQTGHEKAEQASRRNWRHIQKTRQEIPDGSILGSGAHSFDKLPNFARKR